MINLKCKTNLKYQINNNNTINNYSNKINKKMIFKISRVLMNNNSNNYSIKIMSN